MHSKYSQNSFLPLLKPKSVSWYVSLPSFIVTSRTKAKLDQLIFFGANDLNRGPSTKQYVPLPQFVINLKAIISHPLIQAHSPKIILVTPGPVDEATSRIMNVEWANSDEPRRVSWTREYRDAVKKVGEEEGLGVVDIWSAFMGACGYVMYRIVLLGNYINYARLEETRGYELT